MSLPSQPMKRVLKVVSKARQVLHGVAAAPSRPVSWSAIEIFQQRLWREFTGGDGYAPEFVLDLLRSRLRGGLKHLRGIAVACGELSGERYFFESDTVPFEVLHGYDRDEVALRRFSPKRGLRFTGHAVDCDKLALEPESAELIVAWHGLQKVANLTQLFSQCNQALTRDGVMVMYEWVGPNALQLPRSNRLVATVLLLALFPSRAMRRTHFGRIKGLFFMQLSPSALGRVAPNSQSVRPEFERYFRVIKQHGHGGLTYPMFEGLAQNLDQQDASVQRKLRFVQACEERLTEWGVIDPLLLIAVGEPRKLDPL